MSIFVAILGLAFLILIHEAGHFFDGARGRDAAAQVLPRLPAARSRRVSARAIEYGIGADPARRLREDPRDAPARGARPRALVPARRAGGPSARARRSAALAATLDRADYDDGAGGDRRSSARRSRRPSCRRAARRPAERGSTELRDGVGADAYWRQPRLEEDRRHLRRARRRTSCFAIVLFAARLHGRQRRLPARLRAPAAGPERHARRRAVLPGHPAEHAGLRAGRPDRRDRRHARSPPATDPATDRRRRRAVR